MKHVTQGASFLSLSAAHKLWSIWLIYIRSLCCLYWGRFTTLLCLYLRSITTWYEFRPLMELILRVFWIHRAAHIKRFALWLTEILLIEFTAGSRLKHNLLCLLFQYHLIFYITVEVHVFFLALILRHPGFYRWACHLRFLERNIHYWHCW